MSTKLGDAFEFDWNGMPTLVGFSVGAFIVMIALPIRVLPILVRLLPVQVAAPIVACHSIDHP